MLKRKQITRGRTRRVNSSVLRLLSQQKKSRRIKKPAKRVRRI